MTSPLRFVTVYSSGLLIRAAAYVKEYTLTYSISVMVSSDCITCDPASFLIH